MFQKRHNRINRPEFEKGNNNNTKQWMVGTLFGISFKEVSTKQFWQPNVTSYGTACSPHWRACFWKTNSPHERQVRNLQRPPQIFYPSKVVFCTCCAMLSSTFPNSIKLYFHPKKMTARIFVCVTFTFYYDCISLFYNSLSGLDCRLWLRLKSLRDRQRCVCCVLTLTKSLLLHETSSPEAVPIRLRGKI